MKQLHEVVGWDNYRAMQDALHKAIRFGRPGYMRESELDWDSPMLSAAMDYLVYYKDLGKPSAYGPIQEAINQDAQASLIRGFIVGWMMNEAMMKGKAE